MELTLDQAADPYIIVDSDHMIVHAHPEAPAFFGRTELKGVSVHELLPTSFRQHHRRYLDSWFKNPTNIAMARRSRIEAQRADDSLVRVEIMVRPVRDNGVVYAKASIRDASHLDELENEIEQRQAAESKALDLEGELATMRAKGEFRNDRELTWLAFALVGAILVLFGTLLMALGTQSLEQEAIAVVSNLGGVIIGFFGNSVANVVQERTRVRPGSQK